MKKQAILVTLPSLKVDTYRISVDFEILKISVLPEYGGISQEFAPQKERLSLSFKRSSKLFTVMGYFLNSFQPQSIIWGWYISHWPQSMLVLDAYRGQLIDSFFLFYKGSKEI